MKLTDTNIVEREYTLELMHEMFKPRFHKYLENKYFCDDILTCISMFNGKYMRQNIEKLKNERPLCLYPYNGNSILQDIITLVQYKLDEIHQQRIDEIKFLLKKYKKFAKHLEDAFVIAMDNAEKDFERQRIMMEYGTRGKNKEYLEGLYEKIKQDIDYSSIEENSVRTYIKDLVPNPYEIIRESIRHIFTSYTPNPSYTGRPILAAHLISRLDDPKWQYRYECIDDDEIIRSLFIHKMCKELGFEKTMEMYFNTDWDLLDERGVNENLHKFMECLVGSMEKYITEKDVEKYKRNAKKNIDSRTSTEKF